jgi:hypothetical protein
MNLEPSSPSKLQSNHRTKEYLPEEDFYCHGDEHKS